MKKYLSILALIAFIFLIVGVASQTLFGKNSLRQQHRLARNIDSYQKEIDSLNQVIDMRNLEIEHLKKDSLYKEGLLRTRYGMSRKGEVVFQLAK